ncbi:MAG: flagellar basal body L-ring protein FlgH [Proteobacteria bacterium]|nr:flagellar basal body L-ring protein FlgH [Pseudomonadota bacterium]
MSSARPLCVLLLMPLAACSAVDRLKGIGEAPPLSAIENPVAQPGYRPVQMPMPPLQPRATANNSLWRSGSRAFFKDQRAAQVGDLLTVRVRITDSAKIDNSTQRSRQNGENFGAEAFFGAEQQLSKILSDGVRPEALVKGSSSSSSNGAGSVKRQEQLATDIAAIVTQTLPNGNLVIEGRQEVRVNFEVRELIVAGVVRPEDIEAGNTIESTKIAQARISYGGRGQISDVQQPRYGQQALDVLLPF